MPPDPLDALVVVAPLDVLVGPLVVVAPPEPVVDEAPVDPLEDVVDASSHAQTERTTSATAPRRMESPTDLAARAAISRAYPERTAAGPSWVCYLRGP